jgi:small GTP-binding protein
MKGVRKQEEPFDYLQKIIIIGDSGVGKSNMLLRYAEGKFVENYMMTIGINYVFKVVEVDGVKVKLQIWDTAGQDKYKTITQNYYRNSQGVLIVFGIDSLDSFHSVRICYTI